MDKSKTVTFAREGGVDVQLDYLLPPSASSDRKVPILIWFHGGGLLQGTRKAIWPHLTSSPAKHHLCLVSADYRLAPQTRMPGIMSDLASLMTYLRSPAFEEATGGTVDQSRIIVSGGSAGGWLALLIGSGIGFEECGLEKPKAPLGVCAIYPISDLLDPFWTTKQHPVSYMKHIVDRSSLEEYLDPNSSVTSSSTPTSPRAQFYHYMVQEGILADLLLDGTGIPPESFSIAPQIASGRATLPPTYIVHGTIDDKVPIRQSEDVVAACKKRGIRVEFDSLEAKDHLFDMKPEETMDNMYSFIASLL